MYNRVFATKNYGTAHKLISRSGENEVDVFISKLEELLHDSRVQASEYLTHRIEGVISCLEKNKREETNQYGRVTQTSMVYEHESAALLNVLILLLNGSVDSPAAKREVPAETANTAE